MKLTYLFKLLFMIALVEAATFEAFAYDFAVDGIYYNINGNEVSVTCKDGYYHSYSGSVTIPETVTYNGKTYTVTSISWDAFRNSTGLTKVDIPNTVTSIGFQAFSKCSGLKSLIIPNSVKTIDQRAFEQCTGLNSIDIGNSVSTIESLAFYGCNNITHVNITDVSAWCQINFLGPDANPLYYAKHLFLNGEEIKDLIIPESVNAINKYAFYRCEDITSVSIGNSVISIGEDAFGRCSSLTNLILGNSVTEIGMNAFQYCTNLTEVTIPNSVISIGSFAFQFCDGIKSLNLGNAVEYMGDRCFQYCTGLTDIIIPNSVITIDAAFYQCTGLKSVSLGNSIQTIGNSSFFNCNVLKDITIPNSVVQIGSNAFGYCANLTSVTIPDSVISIGRFAFGSCRRLNSVRIGKSVKLIEEKAFNTEYNNYIDFTICGSIDSIGTGAFNHVKTLYIKSEVTKIPNLNISPNTIYCYAPVPPTCQERTFSSYGGALHVPSTSLASYFTANYWSNFINITGDAIEPTSIDLNYSLLDVSYGEQKQIIATVLPNGAYPNIITWTSTDPSIAIVSNGIISAVAEGECDVIASCFNLQAVCHVIVKNDVQTIITLDQHELRIKPNEMTTLTATSSSDFLPDLVVSSSDPTVAAARVVNNIIQVVGVKYGTAIITVGSADGLAQTDSCFVTVYSDTIKGDVNGDGEVNIADINAIIDMILSGSFEINGDVNADGEINIADINAVIDQILTN